MFRRVRALIARGHAVANQAELTLQLAQALIEDIQDGLAVKFIVDDDAAKQVAKLLIGHGGEFPVAIAIDPEYDTNPSPVSKFVGGPYDGKLYRIPEPDVEDGDMTLKGGHRYKWDGKVFRYVED